MEREIKFRGLRVYGKGWVYGDLLCNWTIPIILSDNDGNEYKVNPETIGQFTGLKDKNGKDIYEGDQLHSTGYLCTVIWMNGCFRTVYNHPEDGETLILGEDIDHSNMEVIGNIHEK